MSRVTVCNRIPMSTAPEMPSVRGMEKNAAWGASNSSKFFRAMAARPSWAVTTRN
jgi:hypothetical protein